MLSLGNMMRLNFCLFLHLQLLVMLRISTLFDKIFSNLDSDECLLLMVIHGMLWCLICVGKQL